jgi:glycosyltransferase involved in cell wall biosynthesis
MGRLREQKNPLAFVEGAARVARDRPDVQFVLLGDGPLRAEVEARVRDLDLAACIHLAGWRDDAYRLLAAADVVTLTSRWEGTPYALLEAMAWSLPVVATAVNGCPEVVRDAETGFLVPPGDDIAWAEKVIEVLADPARARAMGRQGRKQVEERFTLQQMVARVEELYRQVVQR